ncbi:MAG: TadE/TadG family protein [Desulfovibrionaceae bacterium]|nr:TadE/TadG family protein [Desulfovibrionaceae bacterium]MBF0512879.1 TadE/TadG family protein [Desulfovibrionaceae bacterium]
MPVLALSLPVLAGLAGLAVDGGNLYISHNKLQSAVDSAALSASLQLPYDPNLSKGLVQGAAATMVGKDYPGATVQNVTLGTQIRSACVTAQASVNLTLMAALGIAANTVTASSCAGFNNLEIALVLDDTGSMAGAPITAVRNAATDLVNLVIPVGGASSTKVGLVPFRGKIHLGTNVDGKTAGCRNADGSVNTTNTASCNSVSAIQALTTNPATIINAINTLTATGTASGTVISEGIKWGQYVLLGPYFTQGGPVSQFRKVMILLTDGETEDGKCGGQYAAPYDPNDYWYNAYYGMGVQNCHCGGGTTGCLNAAMLKAAANAKAAGVEIFCIRYSSDSNATAISMMQTMASSTPGTNDHYFTAPTNADISTMFNLIGQQLGLRLIN